MASIDPKQNSAISSDFYLSWAETLKKRVYNLE